MKYAIYKDVVTVQGHGAWLLFQVGSTVLCLGDSGDKNSGARLEICLFAPMAEKRFTVKWRGLTKRALDSAPPYTSEELDIITDPRRNGALQDPPSQ